ncbi:hypothetical protein [Moorena sp. SIO3H5]|uniref:hypothetical protein n=1 Tax=Moorena sp. SIO3H5 TaxID=2607834 RepID=UPI0013B94F1D|nr:hypothetical protein [Moorena sp. SIO3H5]NEO71165.1 hypothetical protein [Moorena sp. SIO3H5]
METIEYTDSNRDLESLILELVELKQKNNKNSIALILPVKNEDRIAGVCKTAIYYLFGSYTISKLTSKYSFAEIAHISPISELILVDASHPDDDTFVNSGYLAAKAIKEAILDLGLDLSIIDRQKNVRISQIRRKPEFNYLLFSSLESSIPINQTLDGKGSGMYQGIALSKAYNIAFSDCDIKQYNALFLFKLLKAFLSADNDCFVTSHYQKCKYPNKILGDVYSDGYTISGRASRLAFHNLHRSLFNCGIDDFGKACPKYPLSGEFIIPKNIIESITFPTAYGIETAINFFVLGKGIPIRDVNLGIKEHVPQSDSKIENMVSQIFDAFLFVCQKHFPEQYEKIILQKDNIIESYKNMENFDKLDQLDQQRLRNYSQLLEDSFNNTKSFFIPPLKQINYYKNQNQLIQRVNIETQAIFKKIGSP